MKEESCARFASLAMPSGVPHVFFTKLMENFMSARLKFGSFILLAICSIYKFGDMGETVKVLIIINWLVLFKMNKNRNSELKFRKY